MKTKKTYHKKDFPTHKVRRFLEPGPIVLVSSRWKNNTNIMAMGWHTLLEFSPSLFGCLISSGNHSFEMIKKSKECVINIPTADMIKTVIGIGNCHGDKIDKFKTFALTSQEATHVKAPLIKECYANFECRIADSRLIKKYNFFIFEILKAHVPSTPKYPETIHYTGDGIFMISGKQVNYRKLFQPENL